MKTRLPAAVYALGLTSLLNDAAGDMIYPLLPVFLAGLGGGPAALGIIEGLADAFSSVLKLLSGQLSDRVGRRKPLVVAGYAVASAVRPVLFFAGSAAHVLSVRLADRFGKGLRSSARDALIADVTPPAQHGRAFGVHEAMDHAGAVLGPLLAWALMANGAGVRTVFLWSLAPALAAVLVVVLVVREPERHTMSHAGAELRALASPATPIASRPLLGFLGAVTIFALGNSSDAFLLWRAQEAGLPAGAIPLLWAVHNLVKSAAGGWAGGLADRIGRRRALAIGWTMYAAIYAGFALARGPVAITALFVGYGLHFALVGGAAKALVAELVPAHARARGYGYYHLCVGLAALPASALFGWLYQRLGPAPAFLTGAALALGAVALLPLSRGRRG